VPYFDTSALVPYYTPEAKSQAVERLVYHQSGIVISPLVELELFSALNRKVRTGEISLPEAQKACDFFNLHKANGFYRFVTIAEQEFRIARNWLAQFSTALRTLDALHLAAAFYNELILITADQKLVLIGKKLGIEVKLI
jgi:hypothetical protein